jgi:hypothetical protein
MVGQGVRKKERKEHETEKEEKLKKHGRRVPEAIGSSETEGKWQTFHLWEPASAVSA